MKNMIGFAKKGTQKEQVNYMGIPYLFEIMDWNLFVYGDTYPFKNDLKSKGFWWDSERKAWYKNFTSSEDLEKNYIEMENLGLFVEVDSIFREVRALNEEV